MRRLHYDSRWFRTQCIMCERKRFAHVKDGGRSDGVQGFVGCVRPYEMNASVNEFKLLFMFH